MVGGVANTITRTYDGLDQLREEVVVQGSTTIGTVDYTYDAASRRATMMVSGQNQIVYTWDNANRLTQVTQGSATVAFGYDNANRRTSLTLPNAIVATYTYDSASQLAQMSYDHGGGNVGTLSYNYDNAGRVEARGAPCSSRCYRSRWRAPTMTPGTGSPNGEAPRQPTI
jgi:YD repeat-containing protein